MFASAEALRASRQYIQARQAWQDFVRHFPDSPLSSAAWLALGHVSLILEQYAQAAPYYRVVLERFPGAEQAPAASLGLGIALYHQQDYAPSLAATRQYLERVPAGPDHGLALYYSGAAALKLQRYVEGIGALHQAASVSTTPAVKQQAEAMAASALRAPLPLEALQTLAQQYGSASPGELVLERLAQEYRHTGDLPAEAETLQRLTTAFPHLPNLQETQARLHSLRAQLPGGSVKLGVLFPLSGPGSKAGTRALRGVELALAMVQARQPGLKLTLATRDSTQNTEAAREALRALVRTDHVIGVIGPLLSRTATELVPVVDQLGIPLLSPYARDSKFPALSPYAFRNSLTDATQARFLADYAIKTLRLQRFVILHPDDPYGTALRDRFQEQIRQRQGEVVAVLAYNASTPSIRHLVGRLKGLAYEAIFLPEYADKVGTIVSQLVTAGIKGVQLLGPDAWNAPVLVAREARLLEGAVFVDGFFAQSSSPQVKTFVEQFRARYHEMPDLLAAQAYDALLMCAQVLTAGASTPAQLRDGLMRITHFAGVSGPTSMGPSRDAEKVPYFLTVKRGQIVELPVPTVATR